MLLPAPLSRAANMPGSCQLDAQGRIRHVVYIQLSDFTELARLYKQINAAVGEFGLDSLVVSTKALESRDSNDQTYTVLEDELSGLTDVRDALAADIRQILENAEFNDGKIDHAEAQRLSHEAQDLLQQMQVLTH